ncbi:MAG: ABC transporter ATP-binding protein [Bryobacteraceae bacterium]|nr:ABC transporter ATP-binding protein [Bryobacteraceae bacterium]
MQPVVEVSGLRFRYDDGTAALQGVDFHLFPGETVALFGANGSGKTTFVLHLNGVLTGEGRVVVCGMPVTKENLTEIRRRVGIVFQEADEQLFMPTVLDDVSFGPLNLGIEPAAAVERAKSALGDVGMLHALDKAPYHLSAGEKRRVALAGVLAMNPEILILDEPTTSLDPPGRRDLARLLGRLPQAKIIVTHDAWLARRLAVRSVFFEGGRIMGDGATDELLKRFDWECDAAEAMPARLD